MLNVQPQASSSKRSSTTGVAPSPANTSEAIMTCWKVLDLKGVCSGPRDERDLLQLLDELIVRQLPMAISTTQFKQVSRVSALGGERLLVFYDDTRDGRDRMTRLT